MRVADLQHGLGQSVRAARLRVGMSQEDLAAAASLDRTYVSGLELGRRNPALNTLQKIATALSVRLSDLIAEAESEERPVT